MKKQFILLFLLILVLSSCQTRSAELLIGEAWARPGASGDNSAVYFVVDNPGQADALLSVGSQISGAVELHHSMQQDGAMVMQLQERIEMPANDRVELEPGGLHVMLIALTRDLKAGDTFDLTLTFARAGSRKVVVSVREP
ncbi:MAG: copper chaperone PCu(A)C [Anaerolineales bacterium]|nr:copper chaperone PCu(A)C [Anaerolineales bacterium]